MPVLLRLKSENVATPLTAVRLAVPPRVAPPAFVPMASVTVVVAVPTVLPNASCTVTCTAGASAAPATAGLGWIVNAS